MGLRYCTIQFVTSPLKNFDQEIFAIFTEKTGKEIALLIEKISDDKLISIEEIQKPPKDDDAYAESFKVLFVGVEPDPYNEDEEGPKKEVEVYISFYNLIPERFYVSWDGAIMKEANDEVLARTKLWGWQEER